MGQTGPLIRNISDTARWAAVYRARESDRRDALFRDPFARRLAGTRGEQIAQSLPFSNRHTWSWVTRTYLFDQFITEQVQRGVDMVINLAAGLDARPYRMALPSSLKWMCVMSDIRFMNRSDAITIPTCTATVRSTKTVSANVRISTTMSLFGARKSPANERHSLM